MFSHRVCFFLLPLLSVVASTQTSVPANSTTDDYSQEASVIESMSTKVKFENSGSFTREQSTRVHVQTDAGVKQWGLLTFPFQSATQAVEIDYVRVHKPDGSTVITPPENVQDLDAEITRAAPFYSDLREKHVAVKGLAAGDTLEYGAHWRTTTPLIPGQFWFQYNFQHDAIVLNERLEIRVPTERLVKIKGPQSNQTNSREADSHVYTWTYSNLPGAKELESDLQKETEAALGRLPAPDVQISSFQNWGEVGRWYWTLQKNRVEPSAAVRAKAAELTQSLTDDAAKLRAIYTFVSTQYRYIGIAFGIGRYQPHAADDVLSNNYGDCKDKHTLLASLLQASGVTIYPALISSSRKLDLDVPSPAQFDHIIGYLQHGTDAVWLDTTPEVAPFGFLLPQLRDKPALVMSGEGTAQILNTPADPPISGAQTFKVDARLKDDGTLEAKMEETIRGENEILLRAAFRRVPQTQWKDLVQQISYALGYSGTVSDASASTPEALNEPFHFSYSYNRKNYPDWGNHQFTVPGLPFTMPAVRDDANYPVWLGSPLEIVSDSKVQLPVGYTPELPLDVNLNYDFADYHASYSGGNGLLVAKRRLLIKLHEVPVAEFAHYRSFLKDMENDVNRYVQTSSATAQTVQNGPPSDRVLAFLSHIRGLPDSSSSEASKMEANARDEISKHDLPTAVSSLYRAVVVDPKFARAWVFLGMLLMAQKQEDAGIDAFHEAMLADPNESTIPKALGYGLMAQLKFEDAVPVWQDFIKAHPEDADGPANLGTCLLKLNRYTEAAANYESALKSLGDHANLEMSLASAYLLAGERDKAAEAFKKLAAVDLQRDYLNDAAYQMANADLQLPLAMEYAQMAVQRAEEDSETTTLQDLKIEDLQRVIKIAAYWDTLGWTDERMSNMEQAERYLQASWRLTQDGVVAGHLCHLYKRMHQNTSAIQMCRMAISRMSLSTQLTPQEYGTEMAAAQENLNLLTGRLPRSKSDAFDTTSSTIAQRTFKLPRFLRGTESAEFFVLLSSDTQSRTFKVQDVKFVSGSEKMKMQGTQLKNIDFNVPAPSAVPTRFVWRGILGCYEYTGCSFVVLDPATVHSVN